MAALAGFLVSRLLANTNDGQRRAQSKDAISKDNYIYKYKHKYKSKDVTNTSTKENKFWVQ